MTAGASLASLLLAAAVSLPILLAAGMSLMDTTDGVFMVRLYDWARVERVRRTLFNVTTTSFSVAIAFSIGTIEFLQLAIRMLAAEARSTI